MRQCGLPHRPPGNTPGAVGTWGAAPNNAPFWPAPKFSNDLPCSTTSAKLYTVLLSGVVLLCASDLRCGLVLMCGVVWCCRVVVWCVDVVRWCGLVLCGAVVCCAAVVLCAAMWSVVCCASVRPVLWFPTVL